VESSAASDTLTGVPQWENARKVEHPAAPLVGGFLSGYFNRVVAYRLTRGVGQDAN